MKLKSQKQTHLRRLRSSGEMTKRSQKHQANTGVREKQTHSNPEVELQNKAIKSQQMLRFSVERKNDFDRLGIANSNGSDAIDIESVIKRRYPS